MDEKTYRIIDKYRITKCSRPLQSSIATILNMGPKCFPYLFSSLNSRASIKWTSLHWANHFEVFSLLFSFFISVDVDIYDKILFWTHFSFFFSLTVKYQVGNSSILLFKIGLSSKMTIVDAIMYLKWTIPFCRYFGQDLFLFNYFGSRRKSH